MIIIHWPQGYFWQLLLLKKHSPSFRAFRVRDQIITNGWPDYPTDRWWQHLSECIQQPLYGSSLRNISPGAAQALGRPPQQWDRPIPSSCPGRRREMVLPVLPIEMALFRSKIPCKISHQVFTTPTSPTFILKIPPVVLHKSGLDSHV